MYNYLKKYTRNRKTGYVDNDKKVVIEAIYDDGQYDFIKDEHGNPSFAIVSLNEACGVIDAKGDVIIPFLYEEIIILFGGLFAVRIKNEEDWMFGVVDVNKNVVIPFDYKYIEQNGDYIIAYKEATSSRLYTHCLLSTSGRVFGYKYKSDEVWYNSSLKPLFLNDLTVIEAQGNYLITCKNDKLGVTSDSGTIIINHLYSEIYSIGNGLFTARLDSNNSWTYGLLNSTGAEIIPFNLQYKYIKHKNENFIECYVEAECEYCQHRGKNKKFEYSGLFDPSWYNRKGKLLLNGEAGVLSSEFLEVKRGDLYGVMNINGDLIANYSYDHVAAADNHVIISRHGLVGVIGSHGEIIINPIYKEIECASVDINNDAVFGDCISSKKHYRFFNKNHYFDSSASYNPLLRIRIFPSSRIDGEVWLDFTKYFILRTDSGSEIFSKDEGVLPDSFADDIQVLNNNSFAVQRDGLWGIYRADEKSLTIPCQYDRIRYKGDYIVYLCEGEKWGAQNIEFPAYVTGVLSRLFYKVSIPTEYKEIKVLYEPYKDKWIIYFGVKLSNSKYTIVNKYGKQRKNWEDIYTDGQFEYYTNELLLTQIGEKYGFYSLHGNIRIPFIYDEIEKRIDNSFNVRIGSAWGVMDFNGREVIRVKYSDKLPDDYANTIVRESISGRFGLLGTDGSESIPTIYEKLFRNEEIVWGSDDPVSDNRFYYYGINCRNCDYDEEKVKDNTFFSQGVDCEAWGVLDPEGHVIIDAKYNYYKIQDNYILAGRDGGFLWKGEKYGDNGSYADYSGVYDLYTFDGELLFGGFRQFEHYEQDGILLFFFGGEWETLEDEYDYVSFRFERKNGRWLALDSNFKSFKQDEKGKQKEFGRGFIGEITLKIENDKRVFYWNMPLEIFSLVWPRFWGDYMLIDDKDKEEAYFVRMSDGKQSILYSEIYTVMGDSLIVRKNLSVMLVNIEGTIIDNNYIVMTEPVGNYIFGARMIDNDNCSVDIITINDFYTEPQTIIECIEYKEFVNHLRAGDFRILNKACNQDEIILPESNLNLGFIRKKDTSKDSKESHYWYSDKWELMDNDKYNDDYDDYDDTEYDYRRDTWDAMTDGMYGDIPEGFGGDYDPIGF